MDEILAVSPVSYLTSIIPERIPSVGSYTLCDNTTLNGFYTVRRRMIIVKKMTTKMHKILYHRTKKVHLNIVALKLQDWHHVGL